MFNTVCISFGIIIINIIIIIYSISDYMFNVQITQLNFLSLKLQKPILTSFWITRNIWVWINPQQSFLCLLLHLQLLVSIVLMTLLYHIWEHRDDIFILLCYLTSEIIFGNWKPFTNDEKCKNSPQKLFSFSRYLNFCFDFFGRVAKRLN